MALIKIWVPYIGTGTDQDPYRPDIPAGIPFSTDDGMPINLLISENPPPTNSLFQIVMDETYLPQIMNKIEDAAAPEQDQLMVKMLQTLRGRWDALADAFFDAIPNLTDLIRKKMAKAILLQAVARGLSTAKALKIIQRLKL